MKQSKTFGLAAVAVMALTALATGNASATTIEVGGVTQTGAVKLSGSVASAVLARTDGSLANECTGGSGEGTTQTPFTGTTVTGTVTEVGSGPNCTRSVTVHKFGNGHIQWTSGTNGTVSSSNAEVTVGSVFGTLNCKTGASTHMGTLTGSASGNATIHVKAFVNCGFLVPCAILEGTGFVTSPTGLGVVS